MNPEPTLRNYYFPRPGGHICVTNAPSKDAAATLLALQLGDNGVHEWFIDENESTSRRLATIDWREESEDSWLTEGGWPQLIAILTGDNIGFSDMDLCAALTEQRGLITAAVLRIAAHYMAAELETLITASGTNADTPASATAYSKPLDDLVAWLHEHANLQEDIPAP